MLEIASKTGLPARTPRTITQWLHALLDELRLARSRAHAVDDEEEHSLGVFCVGAPLIDHRGNVRRRDQRHGREAQHAPA